MTETEVDGDRETETETEAWRERLGKRVYVTDRDLEGDAEPRRQTQR